MITQLPELYNATFTSRHHFINFGSKQMVSEDKINEIDFAVMEGLYNDKVYNSIEEIDEILLKSGILQRVGTIIDQCKTSLFESSRTSKHWIQYLRYIGPVKDFIKAERVDEWSLHLLTVQRMLSLFAISGHVNYAKSARLYIQSMSELQGERLPYN